MVEATSCSQRRALALRTSSTLATSVLLPRDESCVITGGPMSYLHRRIAHLLALFANKKLLSGPELDPGIWEEFLRDLKAVELGPSGSVVLASCSPLVRSLAKTLYAIQGIEERPAREDKIPRGQLDLGEILRVQREIFEAIEEVVLGIAGRPSAQISNLDEFLRLAGERSKTRSIDGERVEGALRRHFELQRRNGMAVYEFAKRLPGLNLVLAGQHFLKSTLDSVRSMLLYSDTILIPDPVLPWLERPRPEEAFQRIHLAREAFCLAQLKPLIDADLAVPPLLVFPSWEKSLEASDEQTQDGMAELFLSVFSSVLGEEFEDETELMDFALRREEVLLRTAQERSLLVAPGDTVGIGVLESLANYRRYIASNRAGPLRETLLALRDGPLLVHGVSERLAPQFHLRENAEALAASPLLWMNVQWHYFQLASESSEKNLRSRSLLSGGSTLAIHALNQEPLRWLGNVPMDALVDLRHRDENLDFRRRVGASLSQVSSAPFSDLERAVAEISRELAAAIREHQRDIERIQSHYKSKYAWEAIGAWTTLGASFLPWLAPYLAPLVSAGTAMKFIRDKYDETRDRDRAARSLTGVLAAAARAK